MKNKLVYIIKNLSPWMMDELLCLSNNTGFELVLLRQPPEFYRTQLSALKKNKVVLHIAPFNKNISLKKLLFIARFIVLHLTCFVGVKNFIFGIKSLLWFGKLTDTAFDAGTKIHAQFATQASIIALMCHQYYGSVFSFTFHAHDIYYTNRWFRKVFAKAEMCFSISEYNQRYVEMKYNLPVGSTQLSRLGVNAAPHHHERKHEIPFRVGFLSWFNEKKGLNYLLEAIDLVLEVNSEIQFELAGEGELFESVKAWFQSNGYEKNVLLSGRLYNAEKFDFYLRTDLFVLPSIQLKNDMDGIPVALMEAINYGIPIISTNISGIPEICINEETGILIEQRNSKSIASAILKLYADNELYQKCRKGAIEKSTEYDIVKNTITKFSRAGWLNAIL